jgi:hypothetical protein
MNYKQKLLLQYLLIYPLYNVLGMALGATILAITLSWDFTFAKFFFLLSSGVLIFIFYILNIRIILDAVFR